MNADVFWDELRDEIQSQSVSNHPLYKELVAGSLQRETIAELCAQLKYAVLDGISSLSTIIPQKRAGGQPVRRTMRNGCRAVSLGAGD